MHYDIDTTTLPVYAINLAERTDRREHIIQQFENHKEFDVTIAEACRHTIGAIGLWQSICSIVDIASSNEEEVIIICEDDHMFTPHYSKEYLMNALDNAKSIGAAVVLGGVSWFNDTIPVSRNFFWTRSFSGTQFVVLFKEAFAHILQADFKEDDTADAKLCQLFDNILIMHPFISLQKEFGYSDATHNNNMDGQIDRLFDRAVGRLDQLMAIATHYEEQQNTAALNTKYLDYDTISIPTYIINLPERTERLQHIQKQFEHKPEFDTTLIEACRHEIGAVGLFNSIRKIIQLAIEDEHDVIIICEDDHEFTPQYSRNEFLKNVIEGYYLGLDYMSGGSGRIDYSVPVTANRYWVSHCLSAQFVIIYSKFFQKILDEPFNNTVIADLLFSEMTSNKMLLYPFISTQKDFGYSDVTPVHNSRKGFVQQMFQETANRLERMRQAFIKFSFAKT